MKFLRASFQGWIYCRDNAAECVDIVLKSDAKLPKGHQTWQINEINGLIWPSPRHWDHGPGRLRPDRPGRDRGQGPDQAPTDGFRNDLAEKALEDLGGDTKGTWAEGAVVLTEGGK